MEDNNQIVTEVTENTETTAEEMDSVELTDTETIDSSNEEGEQEVEEKKEVSKKTLRELLEENPEYKKEFESDFLKPRISRLERKLKRDYDEKMSKYIDTENILKQGLKVDTLDEAKNRMQSFYEEQGIKIDLPKEKSLYNENEMKILGEADAEDVIKLGVDEAVNEANDLAQKGLDNMNAKEKAKFLKLSNYIIKDRQTKELKSIGVDTTLLDNKEFNEFRNKFNSSVPIKDIYDLYSNSKTTKPKEINTIGSMKNTQELKKKEFYTEEEVSKMSKEDLDNPEVFKAIKNSMSKW